MDNEGVYQTLHNNERDEAFSIPSEVIYDLSSLLTVTLNHVVRGH